MSPWGFFYGAPPRFTYVQIGQAGMLTASCVTTAIRKMENTEAPRRGPLQFGFCQRKFSSGSGSNLCWSWKQHRCVTSSLHQGDKVKSGRSASWQFRDADPCEEAEIGFGQCIGNLFKIAGQLERLFKECRFSGKVAPGAGIPTKNHRGHLRLQMQTEVCYVSQMRCTAMPS